MNYKIFALPAIGAEQAEQQLNDFLASHKIIQVDRQFINQAELSYWSLCVCYQAQSTTAKTTTNTTKKARIDYREVLTEQQFSYFAALRELRKQLAEQDGVPVFAVFTNEQLAKIVQMPVTTAAQLKSIDGVGESKLNRYGNAVLNALQQLLQAEHA